MQGAVWLQSASRLTHSEGIRKSGVEKRFVLCNSSVNFSSQMSLKLSLKCLFQYMSLEKQVLWHFPEAFLWRYHKTKMIKNKTRADVNQFITNNSQMLYDLLSEQKKKMTVQQTSFNITWLRSAIVCILIMLWASSQKCIKLSEWGLLNKVHYLDTSG